MQEPVTFRHMAKQVPIRFAELLVKLLSFKGVVLGLFVFLGIRGIITPTLLFFGLVAMVAERGFEKIMERFKG